MDDPVDLNIAEIERIESRERLRMGFSDHLADAVTAFAGSMLFVWLHVLWFVAWLVINGSGVAFDPFPFNLLTMIVSLEAIFLSTFVLISENRQANLADRRAEIDLQINMIAEQEATKLLNLVRQIHEYLGLNNDDPEIEKMRQPLPVGKVADAVDMKAAKNGKR